MSAEDLLRAAAPQVLGALLRRYGHFDACEDAVQEALLAATIQWPEQGTPRDPKAWLITVASRRLTDQLRSESARRAREEAVGATVASAVATNPHDDAVDADDTLLLLFLCCAPELTASSQVALTLRAVGGLTTAEIASAFLVPEATMAKRISRAKQSLQSDSFSPPPLGAEWGERLAVVLHVLYLIFNEGYSTSSGAALQRRELTSEAIRLARAVHRLLPDDTEVSGLLALMLLTDARRPARTRTDGALVPLTEQDRSLWLQPLIDEGVQLVSRALVAGRLGPYQLQAAIAALHDEARTPEQTDWVQILALYELLAQLFPNPMAALNQVVAVAEVHGPQAALALLDTIEHDERLVGSHRVDVVRAHVLELVGDRDGARAAYQRAARRTTSGPEQRFLHDRAGALGNTDRAG